MPDVAMLQGSNLFDTVGEQTADTTGITLTANASANTKGTYVEIVSATPIEANGFVVMIGRGSNTGDYLVDLAIGAGGSEKSLVDNIQISLKADEAEAYYFPVRVPVGTRLSARVQCTTGALTIEIVVLLLGRSAFESNGLSRITTIGAATGDSGGVGVDPGASANTKGAYAEISSSTTNPIRQLLIVVGDRSNNAMTACNWLIDLAVGASSSEKILIGDLLVCAGTTNDQISPMVLGPFPVNIPAGTRLAARCQCSINDATDRLIDITLYGMD